MNSFWNASVTPTCIRCSTHRIQDPKSGPWTSGPRTQAPLLSSPLFLFLPSLPGHKATNKPTIKSCVVKSATIKDTYSNTICYTKFLLWYVNYRNGSTTLRDFGAHKKMLRSIVKLFVWSIIPLWVGCRHIGNCTTKMCFPALIRNHSCK